MDIFGNIKKWRIFKKPQIKEQQHYYNVDIWGLAHKQLEEHILDGMTLYYEIVGFLPEGGYIQKDYDYGCDDKKFSIYVYRITFTNPSGKVFEFSAKQVQDWCHYRGLKAVPQLYYGEAQKITKYETWKEDSFPGESFEDFFLRICKDKYNERDCFICKNKVPEEGVVVRIEQEELEAYKQKSNRFYERETKLLDKGESDIESEN